MKITPNNVSVAGVEYATQAKLMTDLHILTGLVQEPPIVRVKEIDPKALAEYLLKDTLNAVEDDISVLTSTLSNRKVLLLATLTFNPINPIKP